MATTHPIGVIGGGGWLGGALIRAAVAKGVADPARLIISGRSGAKGAIADIPAHWTRDNAELVERSDIVVLSVRPPQFRELKLNLKGKLALSVMAGLDCENLAAATQTESVIRAMPNAAAVIGQSFTPWFATSAVTSAQKAAAQDFLAASGEAVETGEERHVDYCTGMTGSGAAFPALLVEALVAHAARNGVPVDFARRAAKKVVAGASQMFGGPEGDTSAIVREMIDYRGVVAAALQAMLDGGFNQAVAAGLDAAAAKAATIASS